MSSGIDHLIRKQAPDRRRAGGIPGTGPSALRTSRMTLCRTGCARSPPVSGSRRPRPYHSCLRTQRRLGLLDDKAAPSHQGGLMNPSLDSVWIADPPPHVEFPLDLNRQVAALVNPIDAVPRAGTGPHVHVVGAQRGEARQPRRRSFRFLRINRLFRYRGFRFGNRLMRAVVASTVASRGTRRPWRSVCADEWVPAGEPPVSGLSPRLFAPALLAPRREASPVDRVTGRGFCAEWRAAGPSAPTAPNRKPTERTAETTRTRMGTRIGDPCQTASNRVKLMRAKGSNRDDLSSARGGKEGCDSGHLDIRQQP